MGDTARSLHLLVQKEIHPRQRDNRAEPFGSYKWLDRIVAAAAPSVLPFQSSCNVARCARGDDDRCSVA